MVKKPPKAESDDKAEEKPKVGIVMKLIRCAYRSVCGRASRFIVLSVYVSRKSTT